MRQERKFIKQQKQRYLIDESIGPNLNSTPSKIQSARIYLHKIYSMNRC